MALLTWFRNRFGRPPRLHPDALTLAELLRPTWPALERDLRASGALLNDGEGDGDGDGGDDGDGAGDGDGDGEKGKGSKGSAGDGDGDGDGEGDGDDGDGDGDGAGSGASKTAEEYRRELRQYERSSKRASAKKDRQLEQLRKKLKDREDADKSDQEKAVDEARKEGEKTATDAAAKERRHDRLDAAVTRLASKGVEIGEGDEAKVVKFADAEDALVHLERAISRGKVDEEDIFDEEHRVQTDAVTTALIELLEDKPHLAAPEKEKPKKPKGSGDGGKGEEVLDDEDPGKLYERVKKGRR